ncbi:hypothetical protein HD806DRAFT_69611 [Xylariaceae sp. AK1471]|nr:hypothetical protein HD806DRAFT_69611 [Xylariaceae sp. AK1471]
MCLSNYWGFICGHADPDGTPLKPTLCGRPRRLPHELMCSPLEFNLRISHAMLCGTCQDIVTKLTIAWRIQAKRWREIMPIILPTPYVRRLDEKRVEEMNNIVNDGIKKGPDHTEHLRLKPAHAAFMEDALENVNFLLQMDDMWKTDLKRLEKSGFYSLDEFRMLDERRKVAARELGADHFEYVETFNDMIRDRLSKMCQRQKLREEDDEPEGEEYVEPSNERFQSIMGENDKKDDKPSNNDKEDDELSNNDKEDDKPSNDDKEDDRPSSDEGDDDSPSSDEEDDKSYNNDKDDDKPSSDEGDACQQRRRG